MSVKSFDHRSDPCAFREAMVRHVGAAGDRWAAAAQALMMDQANLRAWLPACERPNAPSRAS
jgi:hypothetical protein